MADIQIAVIDEKDTQIALAVPGIQGPAGAISSGGSANQVFYKVSGTNYDAGWTFIGNANVDAAAAIAGTKISPNFGSQATVTTGTNTAASFIPTSSSIPSNGIYLPGANQVGVATNGTGRVFVDANGSIGVGISSPTSYGSGITTGSLNGSAGSITDFYFNGVRQGLVGTFASNEMLIDTAGAAIPLKLLTNSAERARIRADGMFEVKGAGTAGSSPAFSVNGSAPANSFVIDSSGRLGIGTSGPDNALHVETTLNKVIRASSSDTGVTNSLLINNGSNYHYGVLGNVSGTTLIGGDVYGLGYTASAGADFTPVLSWTANTGRVGIGTTTVDARLLVSDGTNINTRIGQLSLDNFTGEGAGIRFSRTTSDDSLCALGTLNAGAGDLGLFSRNSLIFATGGASNYSATTERACIDSSGRLLVGTTTTTSAGELLRVKKDSTGTNGAGINFEGSYSLDDDASQTVSIASSSLITITNENELQGALLFATYASATITIISDPSNIIATSDTDTKLCLFKSANTSNVTVKNRLGANKGILIGRITT